jgi:hypothetical protein
VLGDQGNLVINAKMVDRPSGNRTVGRHGGQGTPGRSDALLTAESVSVHAPHPSREHRRPRQSRRRRLPMMTKRHEPPVADGQLNVK